MMKLQEKSKKVFKALMVVVSSVFVFAGLQSVIINVTAQLHPIMFVGPAEIPFGMSFPQEIRTAEFVVVGKWSYPDEINYFITQKPKPFWPEHSECGQEFEYVGDARDYCEANPDDYNCCYPSICRYLEKVSEEDEGDNHNHATLNPIEGADLVDYWLVEFYVPTIKGHVGQDYKDIPIDAPGEYGCDINIAFAEGTYCGDGIKQSPNDFGSGGPLDDGYEDCDGEDGVAEGYYCTSECTLEQEYVYEPEPYCGDGSLDFGEECDDGNNNNGDGCSADCLIEQPPEPQTECAPGAQKACDTGQSGICQVGAQTCDEEGFWEEECVQTYSPSQEVCNNSLDDDCDGSIDCADADCLSDSDCGETVLLTYGGGGGGGGSTHGVSIFDEGSQESLVTGTTVTWFTNLPATSRVIYDTVSHSVLGSAPNYGYAYSTLEDSNMVTFHGVTITGLTPGVTYYWRAVSHASPEVVGAEFLFATDNAPVPPSAPSGSSYIPPSDQPSNHLAQEEPDTGATDDNTNKQEADMGEQLVISSDNDSSNVFLANISQFFKGDFCMSWWIILALIAYSFYKSRKQKKKAETWLVWTFILIIVGVYTYPCPEVWIILVLLLSTCLLKRFIYKDDSETLK